VWDRQKERRIRKQPPRQMSWQRAVLYSCMTGTELLRNCAVYHVAVHHATGVYDTDSPFKSPCTSQFGHVLADFWRTDQGTDRASQLLLRTTVSESVTVFVLFYFIKAPQLDVEWLVFAFTCAGSNLSQVPACLVLSCPVPDPIRERGSILSRTLVDIEN